VSLNVAMCSRKSVCDDFLFLLLPSQMQELPEGSWYCHNCTCQICGRPVTEKEVSTFSAIFKCLQCGDACKTSPPSLCLVINIISSAVLLSYIELNAAVAESWLDSFYV